MAVALGVGVLVIVELTALLTAAGDSVVVGVCAFAHRWCSSGGQWSGQGSESPQRAQTSQTPPFHTADLRRSQISFFGVGTEPDSTALSHQMTAAGNRILMRVAQFEGR